MESGTLTWVDVTERKLQECLEVAPRQIGDELVGRAVALRIWAKLLQLPFFKAGALVQPGLQNRIAGFGAACMVSPQFTNAELSNPRAGVNSRFVEAVAAGKPVMLNHHQIARANASRGLDVFQLYGTLRDDLSPDDQFEAALLMWSKFSAYLSGHRVRTVFSEVISESDRRFTRGSGTRLIDFPGGGGCLACATQSSVSEVPSSVGMSIFRYTKPILKLRQSDQQLLSAALQGETDAEIALTLGITQNAVKARWRSALVRVGDTKPELAALQDKGEGRGPQKRHRVLAYLREHPEELQPFDWKAVSIDRSELSMRTDD
jgi:DNA-binding CsgD family transcriptional regulator